MAVFIVFSGIVPLITGWEEESLIHRPVFGGIPGPLQLAFYTVIPVLVLWGSFRFADRIRNWERGTSDRRRTTTKMSNVASQTSVLAFTCALCCEIRPRD